MPIRLAFPKLELRGDDPARGARIPWPSALREIRARLRLRVDRCHDRRMGGILLECLVEGLYLRQDVRHAGALAEYRRDVAVEEFHRDVDAAEGDPVVGRGGRCEPLGATL